MFQKHENLHAVVVSVHNQHAALSVDSHGNRGVELSWSTALLAERRDEGAIEFEDLDAVVVSISHQNVAIGVDADAVRAVEFADRFPLRTELEQEFAIVVKYLQARCEGSKTTTTKT